MRVWDLVLSFYISSDNTVIIPLYDRSYAPTIRDDFNNEPCSPLLFLVGCIAKPTLLPIAGMLPYLAVYSPDTVAAEAVPAAKTPIWAKYFVKLVMPGEMPGVA